MNDLEQELVDQVIKEHAELTRQRDILAAALRKISVDRLDEMGEASTLTGLVLWVGQVSREAKDALREAGMEPPEAGNLDPDNVWQEEKEDEP